MLHFENLFFLVNFSESANPKGLRLSEEALNIARFIVNMCPFA